MEWNGPRDGTCSLAGHDVLPKDPQHVVEVRRLGEGPALGHTHLGVHVCVCGGVLEVNRSIKSINQKASRIHRYLPHEMRLVDVHAQVVGGDEGEERGVELLEHREGLMTIEKCHMSIPLK